MPLLNYTTKVSAEKTAAEVQKLLVQAGACRIMSEFDFKGVLVGISFQIATPQGLVAFQLPCDTHAVLKILGKQAVSGKVAKRYVNEEQAARVGWRIIKDWTEAQVALVQTQMVTLDQVFLPYACTKTGETVYQRYMRVGLGALITE